MRRPSVFSTSQEGEAISSRRRPSSSHLAAEQQRRRDSRFPPTPSDREPFPDLAPAPRLQQLMTIASVTLSLTRHSSSHPQLSLGQYIQQLNREMTLPRLFLFSLSCADWPAQCNLVSVWARGKVLLHYRGVGISLGPQWLPLGGGCLHWVCVLVAAVLSLAQRITCGGGIAYGLHAFLPHRARQRGFGHGGPTVPCSSDGALELRGSDHCLNRATEATFEIRIVD